MPSPLKSPIATENGSAPTARSVVPLKPPAPSPRRMDTVLELTFAVAKSCLPSPLKSPIATEYGLVPTARSLEPLNRAWLQAGLVTVRVKVAVVLLPPLKAVTVTV